FRTTTFRPPSFVREEEKPAPEPDNAVINLPPPPEPAEEEVDTTEFTVPPPPEVIETMPAAEPPAEEFPERFKSKLIQLDQANGAEAGNGDLGGEDGQGLTVAGEDRNSKYLAAVSSIADRRAKATQIKRIDAMIPEGTLIPGILETAINS
ncbi:conjugal transfer protein TrbI, partial [Mesorhizobium sp. M1A.F.Ca.IN.020.30.1.1]